MKWTWLGLETAPCSETQADPQERGRPQQPRAWRLPLLSARIYLDLRRRERLKSGGGGWSGVGVEREWGRGERERADIWIRQEAIGVCMTKEPAISPDWCHSAALKPCSPPRGGVMCGAQTCLCIQGVILGRWPLSSFGLRVVRILLKGEVCIILNLNLKWKSSPKCNIFSWKTLL